MHTKTDTRTYTGTLIKTFSTLHFRLKQCDKDLAAYKKKQHPMATTARNRDESVHDMTPVSAPRHFAQATVKFISGNGAKGTTPLEARRRWCGGGGAAGACVC